MSVCRFLLELCSGSLHNLVDSAKQKGHIPGLPPADVVTLGLMLCEAVDALHRRVGSLHLDVTPGNILVCACQDTAQSSMVRTPLGANQGTFIVKLTDFGLAKCCPNSGQGNLSDACPDYGRGVRVTVGTPGYAPNEQLEGVPQTSSDVYSLGASLLYALTGEHPYSSCHCSNWNRTDGSKRLQAVYKKLSKV